MMSNKTTENEVSSLSIPENSNLQIGNRNLQVGRVDNLSHTTIICPMYSETTGNTLSPKSFNSEFYHLFVVEDALSGRFIIPSERALTESIAQPLKERFACLSEDTINEIKSFPAIFATENYHYGKTDANHFARLGYSTNITIQDNGIKIGASYFWELPQQKLNDCREKLAIQGASSFNELNRTHWTIKKINLIEVLRDEELFPF